MAENDRLPFDTPLAVTDYEQRVAEWMDTIDKFLLLVADTENWYHFCLAGFFYVPHTGKYAEVTVYPDNPLFSYRCISYSRSGISDYQIHEAEIELVDLIEQLLWYHDPNDFYPTYIPVRWDIVEKDELLDIHPDMKLIDTLYRNSEE